MSFNGTEASRQLCTEIAGLSGGTCLLGFSRGKDSVCAWLWLRQFFHTVIPFHCASVPHLGFVDRSLAYYEQFFGTKIHRFLSGECSRAMAELDFQPVWEQEEIETLNLWQYGNNHLASLLRATLNMPGVWCAYGISVYDSFMRRAMRSKIKNVKNKTFYPCCDWYPRQVVEYVAASGVRLPGDYLLGNRTLSNMPDAKHLVRMKQLYPEDYAKILNYFPLLGVMEARQVFREQRYGGPTTTVEELVEYKQAAKKGKGRSGRKHLPRGSSMG